MENDDLFDELRAANPFRDPGTTPEPTTSADARFEEITMQTIDTPRPVNRPDPGVTPPPWSRPWWQRPLLAAPAGLALVAVFAVAALVVNAVTAPAAAAVVNEAARRSAAFESGRVQITIVSTVERPDGTIDDDGFTIDYRYDGDDFALTQDLPDADAGIDPGAGDGFGEVEIRRVDGVDYARIPPLTDGDSFISFPAVDDAWTDLGVEVDPEAISPEAVLDLLDRADEFREVDDAGAGPGTSYRATMPSEVLAELGPENLPPGLALLATAPEVLPETLVITATVADDVLTRLHVEAGGDTADGATELSVTTTFTELGRPQAIEAPPTDRITDPADGDGFGLPEGADEAAAVLDEMNARRPGLCADRITPVDPADEVDIETVMAEGAAYAQCLEEAGEPAAADAFRSLLGIGS